MNYYSDALEVKIVKRSTRKKKQMRDEDNYDSTEDWELLSEFYGSEEGGIHGSLSLDSISSSSSRCSSFGWEVVSLDDAYADKKISF